MGQVLNVPVSSKNIERTGSKDLRACSCEMQGYRMTMEDAHTVALSLGEKHPTKAFFAVFDGHGGDKASIFMSKKLSTHVAKLEDPHKKESLVKCLQELDAEFLKGEEDREHGSTAVFAVVEQKQVDDEKKWKITVGNLGDSRAIIIRSDGKCESLTKDHKPENKDEERRISAAGGFVRANRVDGQLAMSRAIGDSKYKENHGLPPTQQKVIAVPDVETFDATSGDRLLLYCDGIVEQMTNEDVAKYVHEQLTSKDKPDPGKILAGLIELSLEKGSKDNMSVLMIMFEDGSDYKSKKPEFIAGPYHRYQDDQNFKKAYLDDAKKHGYEGETLFSMAKQTEESMPERPLSQDPSTVSLAFLQNFMKPENENKLNQLLTMFMAGGPEETQEDPDMEPRVTAVDDEPETTSTTTSTSASSSASTSTTTSSSTATSGTASTPGKKKKKKKKSASTASSSS